MGMRIVLYTTVCKMSSALKFIPRTAPEASHVDVQQGESRDQRGSDKDDEAPAQRGRRHLAFEIGERANIGFANSRRSCGESSSLLDENSLALVGSQW